MKRHHFNDSLCMQQNGLLPEQLLSRAQPLVGSVAQGYVERRGVPVPVAEAAGLVFDSDFGGRPAVLIALHDQEQRITSVHGRYLTTARGQNKMLTIGAGNGVIAVQRGWRAEPLIIVEGLFDALSLAVCGWSAVAHIGRWATWLPQVSAGREVWLAFDASRAAEIDVAQYRRRLPNAHLRRVLPPPRCKDWNTALLKRGANEVERWLRYHLTSATAATNAQEYV